MRSLKKFSLENTDRDRLAEKNMPNNEVCYRIPLFTVLEVLLLVLLTLTTFINFLVYLSTLHSFLFANSQQHGKFRRVIPKQ